MSFANCPKLLSNDSEEQDQVLNTTDNTFFHYLTHEFYLASTKDCASFIQTRGYIDYVTSPEEEDFPIAYTILGHFQIQQLERLLRAIYRPQNAYCIHLDAKALPYDYEVLTAIVSCFPNVYLPFDRTNVRWGRFSVLEAELSCMRMVREKHAKWKYLINLTGQEFPLKTNWELVQILSALNGSNAVHGTIRKRFKNRLPKITPRFNVTWLYGSVHIMVVRGYVDYIFTNPRAQDILSILRVEDSLNPNIPDETFYATINYNPASLKVPGGFSNIQIPENETERLMSRYKQWTGQICYSKYIKKDICIFGVLDLPHLITVQEPFVNKLYWDFQPAALDCLEEYHWNKTYKHIQEKPEIDVTAFLSLPHVKNHW